MSLLGLALCLACQQPSQPKGYVCPRATGAILIDGKLDEKAWASAPWTDDFEDIEGPRKPKPRIRTRAKMLWNDQYLFIGAELEEPHVWASLTKHDSVIFRDNDFEVFLDPDGDSQLYSEMEMNAWNTTWDLLLAKPYRAGGPPIDGWEIKGMRTAVHVNGTANDATDKDKGWSVEIAIPWAALTQICSTSCPPKVGDQWRINFSRVEWRWLNSHGKYSVVPNTHEDNWVWSPQGVVDMHRPERWGILQFAATNRAKLKPLEGYEDIQKLEQIWDAERAFRDQNKRWAKTLGELNLDVPGAGLEVTESLFEARLGHFRIDQDLRITRIP